MFYVHVVITQLLWYWVSPRYVNAQLVLCFHSELCYFFCCWNMKNVIFSSLFDHPMNYSTFIQNSVSTVEPHYSEPQKCGHLILTDVLLQYGLHSHLQPYIITSEMRSPRYSVKRIESLIPLVPGLYKLLSSHARLSATADQLNNWTIQ